MSSTHILIIRHGETESNVGKILQGHLDISLNERGQHRAKLLAEALAQGDPVHAVYASDLVRARDTAAAIAQAQASQLSVNEILGLRERHFGECQGCSFAEIGVEWPDHPRHLRERTPEWVPPGGGESLVMLRDRVLSTVDDPARQHIGQRIVIVAHGGVLDILYRAAMGMELATPRTWDMTNTAVNRLLWTPEGLSIEHWGDTSHLDAQGRDEIAA